MSIGAGLGGFVDGLESGMRMRERYDEGKLKREQRDATKQINSDTKTAFAEAQAAGAVEEGDYEAFWKQYALPKLKVQYIESGDYNSAKLITEWGESEAALKGGKLFASAMWKANSGDAEGALKDAIAAGQTNGYIDHGYALVGQDELRDADGNLRGYRVTVKDADGKEFAQDIKPETLPEFISNTLNPVAAGQSQISARQKAAEQERKTVSDLRLHEGKKKIDKEYEKDSDPDGSKKAKAYSDAKNNLAKNDPDFMDLSPEEQDSRTRDELGRADLYSSEARGITGQPRSPVPQKMIVNKDTGKVVSPSGAAPAPEQRPVQPTGIIAPQQRSIPAVSSPTKDGTIKDAEDQLRTGANPEMIRQQLMQQGVPESAWPDNLKKQRKQPAFGLGIQ